MKHRVNCLVELDRMIGISLWCFYQSLVILTTLTLQISHKTWLEVAQILKGQQTHMSVIIPRPVFSGQTNMPTCI